MKILVLSPYPERITPILKAAGDDWTATSGPIDNAVLGRKWDFVVSYGYRHLIGKEIVGQLFGRIINLHISYLPWGRGADPNFWAWLNDEPHGVTIHLIDEGLDTGPILAQRKVEFEPANDLTLSTSYERLQAEMVNLFGEQWPEIRRGRALYWYPQGRGSSHRQADKKPIFSKLPLGWNTPVSVVQDIGAEMAASAEYFRLMDQEREAIIG